MYLNATLTCEQVYIVLSIGRSRWQQNFQYINIQNMHAKDVIAGEGKLESSPMATQ